MDKNILIRDHLERWAKVKRKWIATASQNENRYSASIQILNAIYNRYCPQAEEDSFFNYLTFLKMMDKNCLLSFRMLIVLVYTI